MVDARLGLGSGSEFRSGTYVITEPDAIATDLKENVDPCGDRENKPDYTGSNGKSNTTMIVGGNLSIVKASMSMSMACHDRQCCDCTSDASSGLPLVATRHKERILR